MYNFKRKFAAHFFTISKVIVNVYFIFLSYFVLFLLFVFFSVNRQKEEEGSQKDELR